MSSSHLYFVNVYIKINRNFHLFWQEKWAEFRPENVDDELLWNKLLIDTFIRNGNSYADSNLFKILISIWNEAIEILFGLYLLTAISLLNNPLSKAT